jgi:hypothetical protein
VREATGKHGETNRPSMGNSTNPSCISARTFSACCLEARRGSILAIHGDHARVRAEPFDAIELDLELPWGDVVLDD